MAGLRLAIVSLLLSTGCASVAPSPAVGAWQRLQLMQIGGVYPPDWSIEGATHSAALAHLERWTEAQGFILAPAHLASKNLLGHVSRTSLAGWVILVDADQPADARLYTLLHELAHVFSPLKRGQADDDEVFAELVSVLVCERIGLKVWPQTASYLAARTRLEDQERIVAHYAGDIDRVVEKLTAATR
jgi:hypothetical protein